MANKTNEEAKSGTINLTSLNQFLKQNKKVDMMTYNFLNSQQLAKLN